MNSSKYGFPIPSYDDELNIPLLVSLHVGILEELLDRIYDTGASGDIDCGTWDEDEMIADGGDYSNTGRGLSLFGDDNILDGGDYSNTDGEVIDCGHVNAGN